MTALEAVLARARSAVMGSHAVQVHTLAPSADDLLEHQHVLSRTQELPEPLVRCQVLEDPPAFAKPPQASCELLEALRGGLCLTPAALRLHSLLYRLAIDVVQERGYQAFPNSVTFHLPASLLALAFQVSRQRLYKVLPALVEAGLVVQGGHVSRVGHQNLYDGCLWVVKLKPGQLLPRIRYDDWQHTWRNFADDLAAKRTASALCLQLHTEQVSAEGIYRAIKQWAVIPGSIEKPVKVAVNSPGREVIYRLGELLEAHSGARTALIGELASALARMFNDHHSRRLYAWLMHRAVEAEYRGINAISALACALQRLLTDVAEWLGLRRPGALLVSRLKKSEIWESYLSS